MAFHPQAEADLEALWLGLPEESRNKVEGMPAGLRDSFLKLAHSYALSAYKLGARRSRQDCHRALLLVTEKVHPDSNLESFLEPGYGMVPRA
jgi:hypothetical protein